MCYIDTVKELISLTNTYNLVEIEIHQDMTRIRIKKNGAGRLISNQDCRDAMPCVSTEEFPTESCVITSPMVGTFYRALSPGSKPFIDIGSEVNSEKVVGVIETMKIINEVSAGVTGRVVEVFVEDGEAVEFGQPLFRVQQTHT
ncbi:MAG TPA: acetyl-CoA carboxylase biotin carboxyl carrier protein [Candidatus Brocadiia bacterium]|nr:biotin/lipoyl-binding protein [Planctomycetota bacterium]MDO8092301.1 biotin/lipoyl-containing protein [Candidatus Brocadiales bacterium]